MKQDEYASYDAVALAELVRNGDVSAPELAVLANQAIDQLNPTLNFMADRIPSEEIDFSCPNNQGLLQGVPFLIKQGCARIKNRSSDTGSRFKLNQTASEDDELVTRIRHGGVTIVGQSTMPEFGNAPTTESVLHGPTRNPWSLDHMSGGSSGGSAAAVASGAVPIAHATDGAGSIRIPASCCGLVGLKPTRARTPGHHSGIISLCAQHVLSRTVRDSAVALDALQGPEVGGIYHVSPPSSPYVDGLSKAPRPLKIGFTISSPSGDLVNADCVQGLLETAKICESMGHTVEESPLQYDWEKMIAAFVDIYSCGYPEMVTGFEAQSGFKVGPDNFETCSLAMLDHAMQLSLSDFICHMGDLGAICRQVGHYFTQYDIFLSPTLNQPALPIGQMNANASDLTAKLWFKRQFNAFASFTPIFNATGQPAMTLPLYQSQVGLPIGIQFAARHGDEATLFQLASQLEQAMPWKDRKPDVSAF